MKLTKYEHSCVVLEVDGQSLVIDPGGLSQSFTAPENCIGVVVTHEHFDHLDQEKLQAVFAQNPEAILYTNSGVQSQLNESLAGRTRIINSGEEVTAGNFALQFVGAQHEEIRQELPRPMNIGVVVNSLYFHPGDEFCVPEIDMQWLGLPINAPWAKVKETNTYIKDVKAAHVLAIHDGLLNPAGLSTYENHITAACEVVGSEYHYVRVGSTIELK